MKLSIAMIVKNEEKNLERCLKSIQGLHAELIVVDTGSVDRTVKIAKDFGAKVYYHPWEDNFSKHRNQSFSYATGDWIIQLDADEEFVFEKHSPSVLLSFLDHVKKDINAIAFEARDVIGGKESVTTQLVRAFRNGKVKYRRMIHNEPMYKGDTGICPNFVYLRHYGYDLEPHEKKVKAQRTINLLKKELEQNPKDYDSIFYLSQAYASFADDKENSLKWAIRYAKNRKKIKDGKFHKSVYWSIIAHYLNKADLENAWKWLEIALKEIPGDLDISMALLRYGIMTKNQNFVGAGARAFVTAYENFGEDAAKRGATFVFNYSKELYAFALFHLATTYLEHSSETLKKLYDLTHHLDNRAIQEIQEGLKLWFDNNESVFKHHNSLLSATQTARTLYSVRPKSVRQGLRAAIHQ